jgi:hypothetical protein
MNSCKLLQSSKVYALSMKARITAEIRTIWLTRLFDGLGYFAF